MLLFQNVNNAVVNQLHQIVLIYSNIKKPHMLALQSFAVFLIPSLTVFGKLFFNWLKQFTQTDRPLRNGTDKHGGGLKKTLCKLILCVLVVILKQYVTLL